MISQNYWIHLKSETSMMCHCSTENVRAFNGYVEVNRKHRQISINGGGTHDS